MTIRTGIIWQEQNYILLGCIVICLRQNIYKYVKLHCISKTCLLPIDVIWFPLNLKGRASVQTKQEVIGP